MINKKFVVCDRLRQTPQGESFWQRMMKNKVEISEKEFLRKVDIKKVLDEEETWRDYKNNAIRENDPIKFYKSGGTYFFQRAGFEFIWKK